MTDSQTVTDTHQENSLLSFFVGPYYFCVPAVDVESIIMPPAIHAIPLSPNCIAGMFPHRGDIAVVVSLRKKFGLDERQQMTSGQLILSKISSGLKAFWVDEVLETAATEDLDWHPASEIIRCESFEQFAVKENDVILYTTFERLYAASDSELAESLQGISRTNKPDETDSSNQEQELTEESSSAIPESCDDSDKSDKSDDSEKREDTAPSEETEAIDLIAKGSSSKSDYNKPDPKVDHKVPSRLSGKAKPINKAGSTSNYGRSAAIPSTRRGAAAYAFKQKSLHADSSLHNSDNSPPRSGAHASSHKAIPGKSYSVTPSGTQHKQQENPDRNNFATFTALGVLLVMIVLIIWWLWPEQTSDNNTLLNTTSNVRFESGNNESSQESAYQAQDHTTIQSWSNKSDSAAIQDDQAENTDSEHPTSTNKNQTIFHLESDKFSITVERPIKNEVPTETVTLPGGTIAEIETIPAEPDPKPEKITTPYYEEFTHIVVKGDTLWDIAQRYLGNPWRYPELARLSLIKNPDLIYPGDIVRITLKKRTDR